MKNLVQSLKKNIPLILESPEYQERKKKLDHGTFPQIERGTE
jgi:hypothetical protein